MKTPRKFYKLRQKQKRSIQNYRFRSRCKEAYEKFVNKNFDPLKPMKEAFENSNLKESFDNVIKSMYTTYGNLDTIAKIERLYGCYNRYQMSPEKEAKFQKHVYKEYEKECKKYTKSRSNYNGN